MRRDKEYFCNYPSKVKFLEKYAGLFLLWGAVALCTSPQVPITEYFGSAQPIFKCNLQTRNAIKGDRLYVALITRIYGEKGESEIHLMGVTGKEQWVVDQKTFKISQVLDSKRITIECSETEVVFVMKNKEKIHFRWTGTGFALR